MWTLWVLCSLIFSHGVQDVDGFGTTDTAIRQTAQPSCRYNCGRHMGSCSCSSSCQYYGNCCYDYTSQCYYTTSPPRTATTQPSCRYNCGRHMGSCSCSSSCQYNGNCCNDYYSQCYYMTSPAPPRPTTAQPSCRYNCGSYMGSCSCTSSCRHSGNCCNDYYSYCNYYTTPRPTTGGSPCGGYLYSLNGTFYSPDYPNVYPHHSSCIWYIRPGRSIVQLEFPFIRTENCQNCACDAISVFDGHSTSSRLLGKVCGSTTATFYSTGSYLTVHFKSDYSATSTGFRADYRIVAQGSCKYNCGYNVGNCSCSSSCEYWGNCCSDYKAHCNYTTSPPATTTAQPSCRYNCGYNMGSCSCSSSCQYYGNCCNDYYSQCHYITSPAPSRPTTAQPSCRYNCGNHMGSCSCSSSCQYYGNCCNDYYFQCYYITSPAPPRPTTAQPSCRYNCGYNMGSCSCSSSCQYYGNCCYDYYSQCQATTPGPTGCGGSLVGSGTLSSPNHPNHYQDNAYCTWQLRAPSNQRVFLSFSYLQLENCCNCDYVAVYDGPSVNSRLLGKVCNSTSTPSFVSTSSYMTVLFRTDGSVVGRGFKADFVSTLPASAGRVTCSDTMNIVMDRSYLNSLGFDVYNMYLNDQYCRPQVSYSQVVFNYGLNSCGNIKKFDNGRISYTNTLRGYYSSSGEITRKSHLMLNVACRMEQDSFSHIMYLVQNSGNSSIVGSGRFNTSMQFYTSSSFKYQVTGFPYEVLLNQYLYVQVDLNRRDYALVLFLDTCVASPSPHDFQTRPYYLVRRGCAVDNTVYVYSSGYNPFARFRFQAFQFLRASESVYIQCKVLICPASDKARCRQSCNRRKARDLGSEQESQTLVLGPIKLKEPEKKDEGTHVEDKA